MHPCSRRQFTAALGLSPLLAAATARPNILFILADDLGHADLSCYGRRDYRTPRIDQLASEGMRFTQAYSNSSVCSPTRTALITGRYQYRLPVGREEPIPTRGFLGGLPKAHPTLPSLLQAAGYHTSLVGKWHLGAAPGVGPLEFGYDDFFGYRSGGVDYFSHRAGGDLADFWEGNTLVERPGYLTDLLGDRAEAIIDARAKDRRPFLLSLHFSAPHWPWEGPDDAALSGTMSSLAHYDGGSSATYARMVQRLDARVGRVLDRLKQKGLAGNTLVVFTSDNGGERFSDTWPFSGRKTELLEGGIRVPTILRWPRKVEPGSITDQVAITMDWLPTLLAAAGVIPDPAYPPDGINLLPALAGDTWPRTLFWRYRWQEQRAVREGNWKLLRMAGNSFLFDVVKDPLERANLKAAYPEVFARLNAAYDAWNAGMLPEDSKAYSHPSWADEEADRYGNRRP